MGKCHKQQLEKKYSYNIVDTTTKGGNLALQKESQNGI